MESDEISKKEALDMIKNIIGLPMKVNVWYGGVLDLEFGEIKDELITMPGGKTFMSPKGELSMIIEGNWVLSDKKRQTYRSDYVDFRDAELVGSFFEAKNKILGVQVMEKMKIFTFVMDADKEIDLTGSYNDNDNYFYLIMRNEGESGFRLTHDFKYKKNTSKQIEV